MVETDVERLEHLRTSPDVVYREDMRWLWERAARLDAAEGQLGEAMAALREVTEYGHNWTPNTSIRVRDVLSSPAAAAALARHTARQAVIEAARALIDGMTIVYRHDLGDALRNALDALAAEEAQP